MAVYIEDDAALLASKWGFRAAFIGRPLRGPNIVADTTNPREHEGWRMETGFNKWGSAITWRHMGTGQRVKAVRQDLGGGIYRWAHPTRPHIVSSYLGGDRARRKRILRKVVKWTLASPGLLGAASGFILPMVLSAKAALLTGAAIAVGGYMAPQGSWIRRFSIGAGVGGAAQLGMQLYHKGLGGLLQEAATGAGGYVHGAFQSGVTAITDPLITYGANPLMRFLKTYHEYPLQIGVRP